MNITIGGKTKEVTNEQFKQIEKLLGSKLRTPDNIRFNAGPEGFVYGLFFNNDKQALGFSGRQFNVQAGHINPIFTTNRKLVPINREDLKPGDVVYRSDTEDRSFDQIDDYGIVLNPHETAYTTYQNEIHIDDLGYSFWWKVI